ncbi:MAG TPA: hypothetical protein QGF35_01575 [Dehalococcoidia bacterium]|jgi:3-dehydroquinate dehydratase|nr:hypothetical protein [Dehalococcoidia bacterium]|tara:strand:+ start:137 stop:472 length:336 start_codon:yes stop_codon:yes gene_type:complete
MNNSISLLVPAGYPAGSDMPGVQVIEWTSADEVANALGTSGASPIILVSDGLDGSDSLKIAHAIRAGSKEPIEVRSDRWNGASPSPISSACRGVISGFGPGGVQQAIEMLS